MSAPSGGYSASTSIVVDDVTKWFTLRYHRTLKQMAVAAAKGRDISGKFNALDHVSFTVEQGESIGLMGLNGSGKSTLLKLINGVMRPDTGTVLTRGRIAGLIATGAGFHPQLTGRENVFLNAAVLGMSEAETQRKFDDIVEFADIGRFLDSPVGHYSSGMFARLGFAVAIHVDSDIFLADEVLAVGDKPFKQKCLQKMQEIRDSGRTLFYVSHAAGSVRTMCDRVIVLEQGRLAFDGGVDEGIKFVKYDEPEKPTATSSAPRTPTRSSAPTSELPEPELAMARSPLPGRVAARAWNELATGVSRPSRGVVSIRRRSSLAAATRPPRRSSESRDAWLENYTGEVS